jgi:membrane associated rhomboid family serine protease
MTEGGQAPARPGEPNLPRTNWSLHTQLWVLVGLPGFCWALVVVDFFLPWERSLLHYGVHPRDVDSLVNILFVPFLHAGFAHVIANTFGFVVFGWLVLVRSSRQFAVVSVISAITSGLGCWLFGWPGTIHVGGSGVIFGYLGFLLVWGFIERSLTSIALTLLVAVVFGGMLWGVLPERAGVSWQGHLFGLIGGVLAARFLAPSPAGTAARAEDRAGIGAGT